MKKLEIAIQALQDIESPIAYLRRKAEEEGSQLHGQTAIAISSNADFLKSIARDALHQIGVSR